ncbi:MAG: hypothetical protein QXG09_03560 [Candidatus Bathyarchaeia archaeon]
MKRIVYIAIFAAALCSLLLLKTGSMPKIDPVEAAEPGYVRIDYMPDPNVTITIDGRWTVDNEWTNNGEITWIENKVLFRSVWSFVSMSEVYDTWLVEFFTDNTNDTGDYWQMCIDGDQSGGFAPQAGDYRIDIIGHTTLKVYQGTGTGWSEVTPPASIQWANSISASPMNSTPHWILELRFNKPDLGAGPYWNFRLAVYDESTGELLSWPPTPRDVPDRYGFQDFRMEVVPEGLNIGATVLLSSFSVIVGSYTLRKRLERS